MISARVYVCAIMSFASSVYALKLPQTESAYFPVAKHSSLYRKLSLEHPVRILLSVSPPKEVQWKFTCEGGFSLYDPITGRTKHLDDTFLQLSFTGNSLYSNNQKIERQQLFFLPRNGLLQFNGISYPGIFSLERTTDATYLVNHAGLESYLECVLPHEAVPSWPDEVLKAMTIACRTYAISRVAKKRSLGRDWPYPYDMQSGVLDQVYKGYAPEVNLKRIIDATKGYIITHERKPIIAMFSSVCGGVIPTDKKAAIFEEAPYLKRPYACTHCKDHKLFRWEHTTPLAELEEPLRKEFPSLKSIQSVVIDGFDPAGVAQFIVITDSDNKIFRMAAHDFRMLFYKNIKSICCEITPDPLMLTIKGKGYGHHIGMCQWGAYSMDLQGYTYKSILNFFYPGTLLSRLRKGQFILN